jgi:hypothetical protein
MHEQNAIYADDRPNIHVRSFCRWDVCNRDRVHRMLLVLACTRVMGVKGARSVASNISCDMGTAGLTYS